MKRPHSCSPAALWHASGCLIVAAAENAHSFHRSAKSHWTIEYGGANKIDMVRFGAEQFDAHFFRMLGEPARSAVMKRVWADAGYCVRIVSRGCALPDQFDAETCALFRDGEVWDTLAAWEDAEHFPRNPAHPDRESREIFFRAIRQARADL